MNLLKQFWLYYNKPDLSVFRNQRQPMFANQYDLQGFLERLPDMQLLWDKNNHNKIEVFVVTSAL